MRKFLLLIILCMVLGCSSKQAELTLVSTKNFNPEKGFTKIGKVTGTDNVSIIIIAPTGKPKMEIAISKAIEAAPNCCALADVKIYSYSWWIPYIYGQYGWIVEGTALSQ